MSANNGPSNNGDKNSSGGASVNKSIIVGNIGMPPEWKHKDNQTPYCVFTMCVSRALRRGGEYEGLWFRVTLWGKLAETAVKFGLKSQQVYVEGRMTVGEWTDQEGRGRYTLEIAGSDFQMLGNPLDALARESERLEDEAIRAERDGK